MKGNHIGNKTNRKQGYWKFTDSNTIYWSDSSGVTSFHNPSVYYRHRDEMGYPRNWSEISKITRGMRDYDNNPFMVMGDKVTQI